MSIGLPLLGAGFSASFLKLVQREIMISVFLGLRDLYFAFILERHLFWHCTPVFAYIFTTRIFSDVYLIVEVTIFISVYLVNEHFHCHNLKSSNPLSNKICCFSLPDVTVFFSSCVYNNVYTECN